MNKLVLATIFAATLSSAACTPDGPQTAAPPAPSTLVVFDMTTPGERRTVTPNWTAINSQPLGSKANPVRTLLPAGQQAYLRRLICADGTTPYFRRIGNVGPGPYTTIVDAYDVRCGATSSTVHLDMYHPNYIEQRAVPGFTIRPAATS